ncbi:solute carrier family 23 member 2 [Plakobranchus ocellatus]|uniref:Solute carrier family 23 member 2 n=1 Tax=Plakobranchus ocellatus TaxID=259542 RepID=A0AAV4DPQ7_9GAST|nr:solute carrier family 23 member 2 [Plakobranchus ocellatus]
MSDDNLTNGELKDLNGYSNQPNKDQTQRFTLEQHQSPNGHDNLEDEAGNGGIKSSVEATALLEKEIVIEEDSTHASLRYGLLSRPPAFVTLMSALQHILLAISSCLATSQVVADAACAPYDHPVRSILFCTTLFMVGVCTFLQTTFGIRLPVFQGPSSSFLVPLLALRGNPDWACTPTQDYGEEAFGNITMNSSTASTSSPPEEDPMPGIFWRLQMMSGSLMVAALLEVILSGFGLLKLIIRAIGPITVACTVSLIGVSLYKVPLIYGRPSFWMTFGCAVLVVIFVLYCRNISVPLPRIGNDNKNSERPRFYIFQLIPVLLALIVMWVVTWVLTLANVFTDVKDDIGYLARADAKLSVIGRSRWLQITYPGQFGTPRLNVPLISGFLVAFFTSMIESVGDYFAAQKVCQVPLPPDHAVSRGILTEGLGSVISGAVGAGHATTSYSANIALLSVSKTASRHVMYAASALLIVVSLLGKAGAALTTVPNPVLGGILVVLVGTVFSIGIENLRHVDMRSSRNMVVVGLPFICGIMIPACLDMYPDVIDSGTPAVDQVLRVMLGMPMFIGGSLALILDNTVPGSLESRGMADVRKATERTASSTDLTVVTTSDIYSWTIYPRLLRLLPCLAKLPFMPKT